MFARHTALVAGTLAALCVGQRPVVTVGGFAPDFADLPAAVAAAVPGSVIEVRPGTYTGFATSKPLRIVLQNCTVQPDVGAAYAITIDGVAGTDGFVVYGESATVVSGALGAVRVANCGAPVVLESLLLVGGPWLPALDVQNDGLVHVSRSILVGDPGLQVQLADVTSSENVIANVQGSAAVVDHALFESVRSVFAGNGNAALRVYDSMVRLASDGSGALLVLGSATAPISALAATTSTVQWDPGRFLLVPLNGAPAYVGLASTEVLAEVPMLTGGPAAIGGTGAARLTFAVPSAGLIAVGTLRPVPLPFGPAVVYPDPNTTLLGVVGLASPAGLVYSAPIPNNPALRGELLCLQGSVWQGNAFTLSGPALWYLE